MTDLNNYMIKIKNSISEFLGKNLPEQGNDVSGFSYGFISCIFYPKLMLVPFFSAALQVSKNFVISSFIGYASGIATKATITTLTPYVYETAKSIISKSAELAIYNIKHHPYITAGLALTGYYIYQSEDSEYLS